jgi:uncharacterized protein (TIGR03382 family)
LRIVRRLLIGSILAAFAAGPAPSANAAIIFLWDFDGNNQVGATTTSEGTFTLDSGTFGEGPYQGDTGGLLESSGGETVATVETNLGLGNNAIGNLFNQDVRNAGYSISNKQDIDVGSAFQLTFTAQAGDQLEFHWNMLSAETDRSPTADLLTYTDFSWWDLSGADAASGVLANVNDTTFGASGLTPYSTHTGQKLANITLATGGSYTITVGVNDVADNGYNSALLLDFFRLVRGPEPGTFGTVAGGLIALSWLSRRRRH